jgi:hypothetical protein
MRYALFEKTFFSFMQGMVCFGPKHTNINISRPIFGVKPNTKYRPNPTSNFRKETQGLTERIVLPVMDSFEQCTC